MCLRFIKVGEAKSRKEEKYFGWSVFSFFVGTCGRIFSELQIQVCSWVHTARPRLALDMEPTFKSNQIKLIKLNRI